MDKNVNRILNSVVHELFEDDASLALSGGNLAGKMQNGREVSVNLNPAANAVVGGAKTYVDAHTPNAWQNFWGWVGDKTGSEYLRNVRDDVLDPRARAIQKGVESVNDNVDLAKSLGIQKAAEAQAAREHAAATTSTGDAPGFWDAITNSKLVRGGAEGLGNLTGSRSIHNWGIKNDPMLQRGASMAAFEAGKMPQGEGGPVSAGANASIAHALEDIAGKNDPWYTKGMREMRQGVENLGASIEDHPWAWGGGALGAALAAGAGAMYLRKKKKEADLAAGK